MGLYLIEAKRWEEAIPWLEEASRYDAPQQAYFNLGRAYTRLGQYATALRYLDLSIAQDPFHRPAIWAKFALLAKMN
jgi:tetratricopeptide (TPR) repeat protein